MSPSKIICGYLRWGPIQVKPLNLSRTHEGCLGVIWFSIATMKKQGLWDVVMTPYASCKNKQNGTKFRRNAWIGLVRGLVFTCFAISTTCIVHPPSFFAEGKGHELVHSNPFTMARRLLVIKTLSKAFVCNPSEWDARLDSYFLILVSLLIVGS